MNNAQHTQVPVRTVANTIKLAGQAALREARQDGRMQAYKLTQHRIQYDTFQMNQHGLKHIVAEYDLGKRITQSQIKHMRTCHEGAVYLADVWSTCGAKYMGTVAINLTTGVAETDWEVYPAR